MNFRFRQFLLQWTAFCFICRTLFHFLRSAVLLSLTSLPWHLTDKGASFFFFAILTGCCFPQTTSLPRNMIGFLFCMVFLFFHLDHNSLFRTSVTARSIFSSDHFFFILFYFIHISRLNSISIILFWENTGSASKNYQIFEISNHSHYSSA